MDNDKDKGLYPKFIVRRVDKTDRHGGKHFDCRYFVLDLDHDVHAPAAMRAYAASCAETHPRLSAELRETFPSPEPVAWRSDTPPETQPIHAYHPDLVDLDFNPQGVVEATFNGEQWVGAIWNGQSDLWNTRPIQIAMWRAIEGPNLQSAPTPKMEIEWIDEWGCKNTLSIKEATKVLKDFYNAWPGGLDEIDSSINGWRNRVLGENQP